MHNLIIIYTSHFIYGYCYSAEYCQIGWKSVSGSLSNHFLQRSRVNGANINLLVIGPAGCGKSTLLSNIYNQEILPSDRRRYARIPNALEFIDHESVVSEAGVNLSLKVTTVLGYGELSFSSNDRNPKRKRFRRFQNVEEKHRQHFDSENYAKRSQKGHSANGKGDQLYHAAILFIQPQRNLKFPHDIAFTSSSPLSCQCHPGHFQSRQLHQGRTSIISSPIWRRHLMIPKFLLFP